MPGGVTGGQGLDQGHIRMGGEELTVGRVGYHYPHRVVGLDLATDPTELEDQRDVEEVDGRMVHRHPGDPPVDTDTECLVVVVGHRGTVRDMWFRGSIARMRTT